MHFRKANWFYTDLKEKTNIAKTKPKVKVIKFDFQQYLFLPPPGEKYFIKYNSGCVIFAYMLVALVKVIVMSMMKL